MAGKLKRIKPRFLTAFILLSAATILLLGFSILFFTSPEVIMQVNAWGMQISPSMISLHAAQLALQQSPLPTLAATIQIPPTTPASSPPLPDPPQEPTRVEPTPEPIYRVVEKLPPDGNLVIPSLGIDLPLKPVAVREQQWDLSDLGSQVGWLQTTGAYPGDDLSMVLIGHITLPYPGGAGPFLNLSSLRTGDVVEYRTRQITYIYQVAAQAVVGPDMVESLYQRSGNSLLLVTCTGYNAFEREYDQRLLVEAVLVRVENERSTYFDRQY